MNKTLRMRHEAEDISLLVADAGNIEHRTVRIGGVGAAGRRRLRVIIPTALAIGQRNLAIVAQSLKQVGIAQEKTPLPMRHGRPQVPRTGSAMLALAIEERTLVGLHPEIDPAVFKLTRDVFDQ